MAGESVQAQALPAPPPPPPHPRLGSAVPMAVGRAMLRVGVLCQAPSPLPPGALECPVPIRAPAAVPGVQWGGGHPARVPPPTGWAARGGWQEGTAVAVGTVAVEGNVPKNETCSAPAWRRGTGTLARPPPRRGGRGDVGWSNTGWLPATAWLQHPWEVAPMGGGDTWGLGNPPGCGGFVFPLIGDVNLGRLSARGAGRRHQLCRAARAAFLIKLPVRRGGRAGARRARWPPWHRDRVTPLLSPEEQGQGRTLPREPPIPPVPGKPHPSPVPPQRARGARPGDAIQNVLETCSQHSIPVPWDGKRWIPWDGKHWGSHTHPSPPKTNPTHISILHPRHITASNTSTFFWWLYPPPWFLFNPFIPPPPRKCQGKVLTDFLEGNV
ncbi:uncharacterized protein ACIBXB_008831 [Morphnus guianensis]